jgi:tripartite-type tricarboxylate transporter receptor subunit TctC
MNRRDWIQYATAISAAWANNALACQTTDCGIEHIKLVVPFAQGGISSQLAVFLGNTMFSQKGVPCKLLHIPGHGGMTAADFVDRQSSPHQPAILMAGPSIYSTGSMANPEYHIDPFKRLNLISTIAQSPLVLISQKKITPDLNAFSRTSQGKRRVGINGFGTASHVVAHYFHKKIMPLGKIFVTGGDVSSIGRLLNNEIDCAIVNIASCIEFFEGDLAFLASTGQRPVPWITQTTTPTFAELKPANGNFSFFSWDCLAAPKNLPPSVQEWLTRSFNLIKGTTAFQKYIAARKQDRLDLNEEEFKMLVNEQIKNWEQLVPTDADILNN